MSYITSHGWSKREGRLAIVRMGIATFFAVIWMNPVAAGRPRRVGARHLVAFVPSAAAIKLSVLVPVVAGVDSVRINRVAVLFRKVAANAVAVHGFSDAL